MIKSLRMNPQPSSTQATSHYELSTRVRRLLDERFDSSRVVELLEYATDGEIYVFGGAIRRALFGDKLSGDIDIMVPNGDNRAFGALAALNVPFVLNSNKHHRYRWNSLQIDLFQPREFFGGFESVEAVLRFFDLRINAMSLHLRSGRILDPFELVSRAKVSDPGINWTRWSTMSSQNLAILAIRLAKIMHEVPTLTISSEDAQRLLNNVIPRIRECDWTSVQQRFPPGKDAFLKLFAVSVVERVGETESDHHSDGLRHPHEAPHGG